MNSTFCPLPDVFFTSLRLQPSLEKDWLEHLKKTHKRSLLTLVSRTWNRVNKFKLLPIYQTIRSEELQLSLAVKYNEGIKKIASLHLCSDGSLGFPFSFNVPVYFPLSGVHHNRHCISVLHSSPSFPRYSLLIDVSREFIVPYEEFAVLSSIHSLDIFSSDSEHEWTIGSSPNLPKGKLGYLRSADRDLVLKSIPWPSYDLFDWVSHLDKFFGMWTEVILNKPIQLFLLLHFPFELFLPFLNLFEFVKDRIDDLIFVIEYFLVLL